MILMIGPVEWQPMELGLKRVVEMVNGMWHSKGQKRWTANVGIVEDMI